MQVRPATAADSRRLIEIESTAGQAFRALAMDAIADDDPGSVPELDAYAAAGRSWVATEDDRPIAYLIADLVDGNLHIEQVTVDPAYARRGVGAALIAHADAYAARTGRPALTLTTFTDVPWNAPYYERLGFRRMAPSEITPELQAVCAAEAQHGLDRWPRVCMIRPVTPTTPR